MKRDKVDYIIIMLSITILTLVLVILVRFNFDSNNINKESIKPEPTENTLVEEKVSSGAFVVLGDNISSRDNQAYGLKEGKNKGYQQVIKEQLNINSYINLGISGTTITGGTEPLRGLSKIAMDYSFGDVNFIIVQAGTNDFALNVPLGRKPELTRDEPDRFNFYGAYAGLIHDIQRNNEGVPIYLITPTQRDCKDYGGICINEEGFYLKDYVEAIKEIGEYYNIPVVNVFENIKITQESINEYTVDGLHLNDKGYELMAEKFIEKYNEVNKKREE